jgi:two-component system, OmpR family, sensor histidine kinase SenX3
VTPRLVIAFVVVAGVGLVLGRSWPPLPASAAVVVVAVVAAGVVATTDVQRLRRISARLDEWVSSGEHRPLRLGGSPAWREFGRALDALGSAYERRGARLRRERPWRRELVDSLVQPALLFSEEGRLLAANDAARTLLGIPSDAVDITVVQAVGSARLAEVVRSARERGEPVAAEVEHGDHDLSAVASVVGDETLLIIADRTNERRVEELRRNFVVNASHELKTPVTSIQTLAEALQVTVRTDPERSSSLVMRLGVEAERLARLVRDLLDLRRLEERGPLERDAVDLAELVRLAVAELVPRADSREVTLAVDAPDQAVVVGVHGDVEVIVKNLVANAVQYNRAGGTVDVSVTTGPGVHVLRVVDTGIGIPHQDLSRVFERFYRVDAARSRETGGTGLGLSIVRHAVERNGGTIEVDSLLGEGTTFTVTLPDHRDRDA